MSLTVLDYGAGNLKSMTNMLDSLGYEYQLCDNKEMLESAERLIFPGVGHFRQVMDSLNSRGLTETLIKKVKSGIPFIGICVGMQVLFEESEEAPGLKGLGLLKGKVVKFTEGKVPQIGWNKLKTTSNNTILTDDYVYFVNSFYVVPEVKSVVSAYAYYHVDFVASVEYKNVTGMQFHPEKSGDVGFSYIKKWLELYVTVK